MEIFSTTHSDKKISDTANTVQVLDCNSISCIPKIDTGSVGKLAPAMLTLIDILARQAAREICGTKEGE